MPIIAFVKAIVEVGPHSRNWTDRLPRFRQKFHQNCQGHGLSQSLNLSKHKARAISLFRLALSKSETANSRALRYHTSSSDSKGSSAPGRRGSACTPALLWRVSIRCNKSCCATCCIKLQAKTCRRSGSSARASFCIFCKESSHSRYVSWSESVDGLCVWSEGSGVAFTTRSCPRPRRFRLGGMFLVRILLHCMELRGGGF